MINQANCIRQPITQFIPASRFNLLKISLPILLLLVSLELVLGELDKRTEEYGYEKTKPYPTRPRQSSPPNKKYARRIVQTWPKGAGKSSAYVDAFNDDMWKDQWYQHDYRRVDGPVVDHNIVPVQRMGYDGKGITIGVIGERLARGHFELCGKVSEIFNAPTGKLDTEKNDPVHVENMATNVAGVVAMRANNSLCGAGIAYNAELVGITVMSGGKIDEDVVVKGMKHKLNDTHIYVDAIKRSHDGEGLPYSKAITGGLKSIALTGRNNKGTIYVKGSGDGRAKYGHCGADFVANSIYTFVIGSSNVHGERAEYSERCAAVIAAAYSAHKLKSENGAMNDGVVTIEGGEGCTKEFSGTAASAAIASGMFALVLQANPDLTWRDLMHIVAISSEKAPVLGASDWSRNGAGFWVSSEFGFGLLNAENMVLAGRQWTPVPKMVTCKVKFDKLGSLESLAGNSYTHDVLEVNECPPKGSPGDRVIYIEQVELVTTISYRDRSTVAIYLTSPAGTRSTLYERRKYDKSAQGFKNWKIRSLQYWGETLAGKWILEVLADHDDYYRSGFLMNVAIRLSEILLKMSSFGYIGDQIRKAELVIHGTSELPDHYQRMDPQQRRTYAFYD